MEKSYIKASEKVAGIKTMGLQAYCALLNTESLDKDFEDGLERANRHVAISNLTDSRSNCPKAAMEFISYLAHTYLDLNQNDVLLKTAYLQILFADQKMFEAMQDLSIEHIANHFQTDINNVMCKLALDNKVRQLENNKPKTYQK